MPTDKNEELAKKSNDGQLRDEKADQAEQNTTPSRVHQPQKGPVSPGQSGTPQAESSVNDDDGRGRS